MDARLPYSRNVVLIVEDEPFTRLMAADVLEKAGFSVLEATNAGEALTILTTGTKVCAVFTDVDMPGPFDGLELARRISEKWPKVSIVITSGHPSCRERTLGRYKFLAKPYTGPELAREISEVTDAAPAADFELAFGRPACI
jgi:two-component system, response regulator PdtaR